MSMARAVYRNEGRVKGTNKVPNIKIPFGIHSWRYFTALGVATQGMLCETGNSRLIDVDSKVHHVMEVERLFLHDHI